MTTDAVLLTRQDGVATITLNRPDAGNAMNPALVKGLLAAANICAFDETVRCVVITAHGRLFCGGGDIGTFQEAGGKISSSLAALAGDLHMAVTRLARMPKPLLVLVNGPAAGAGFSLAMLGDIVLAGRSANFTAAYGAIGLTPDGGLSWLLPRLVGMRTAQEIILADRKLSSEEALSLGMVTQVVDDDALAREGEAWAARLCAASTGAIGAARGLLLESFGGGFESHLDLELRTIAERGATDDLAEGIAAFRERRKPVFDPNGR